MALLEHVNARPTSSKEGQFDTVDMHLIELVTEDLTPLQGRGRNRGKMSTFRLAIVPKNCKFAKRLEHENGHRVSKNIEFDEYITEERMERVVQQACAQFRGRDVRFVSVDLRTADRPEDIETDPKCKKFIDTNFLIYTITFYPA